MQETVNVVIYKKLSFDTRNFGMDACDLKDSIAKNVLKSIHMKGFQ